MKTKQVLFSIFAILLTMGWHASVGAQDIPPNYIQNPNMEHELNAIFWYGGCCDDMGWNGIASFPEAYLSNEDSHSGNWSLSLRNGSYIWVSYPVRGHEEKTMKASFWYRGYLDGYWNFIYRDVGMTYEDLHPNLAEFVGADSAVWGGEGQDAMQFLFGGEDDWTEDWTYFEFVWDMPGTIPGEANTSMWHAPSAPAFVDDLYYGEWYDGQYSGEEPLNFINGDFEANDLNIEWLLNMNVWSTFDRTDYISFLENHSDGGLQSLRLQDFHLVNIDTIDEMEPIEPDSILIDTSMVDRNVTYYLPALGAEGENMELSFWYKGNDASLYLEFYDDYGVTTEEFPLPEGAMLVADSANPILVIDTLSTTIDTLGMYADTFAVADLGEYTEILEMQIDTLTMSITSLLAEGDLDDPDNLKLTPEAWVWSGSNFWGWDDWATAVTDAEAWSGDMSLWLPGDPNWSGTRGHVEGIVDETGYVWEFMYKGQVQFILRLAKGEDDAAAGTRYDLINDPDGIVPSGAVVDANSITWTLDSEYWTKFRFEYFQGSWLADSSITSPAVVEFDFVGSYTTGDVGYVDDFKAAMASPLEMRANVLAEGNLDDPEDLKLTPDAWVWSGSNNWGWDDWAAATTDAEAWSGTQSLWLPGDPSWGGARGHVEGIEDNTEYSWEFMYKGKLQFMIWLAAGEDDVANGTRYDLIGDPAGIVPADATADEKGITWQLESDTWTKFSFEYTQGTWLADSSLTAPATVEFDFVGTYTEGDVGYVDDFMVSSGELTSTPLIDTSFVVIDVRYDIETTYDIDTLSATYDALMAYWELPAAEEWTKWHLNWTNPSDEIGGTLTMFLDNVATETPDIIIPLEKEEFDDEHPGWTYFDDFVYGIAEPEGVNRDLVKYDLHTYPNPAKDILYLSIMIPLDRIEVYNALGQIQMELDHPERVLNISGLEEGIYFLNVTDESGVVHKAKFIKR